MKLTKWLCVWFLAAGIMSCSKESSTPFLLMTTDFTQGVSQDWKAGFAEYSTETDTSSIQIRSGARKLPAPLNTSESGFMLSAYNRSDDMFMYIYQRLPNFAPNTKYNVEFFVKLASDAAEGSVGVGGSPAHSVYLKAGATGTEPVTKLEGTQYVFNLDKGNQANEGKDMIILGDIATGLSTPTYKLIERNSTKPFQATSNAKGELFLVVGTDSGYEGLTTLYYSLIQARFTPVQ